MMVIFVEPPTPQNFIFLKNGRVELDGADIGPSPLDPSDSSQDMCKLKSESWYPMDAIQMWIQTFYNLN